MQPETEFIVRVKKWPAYILAVLTPVMIVGYSMSVGLLVWSGELSDPVILICLAVVVLSALVAVALMVKATFQAFTMIRYPPRISAQGTRLWLFPTSKYVVLPWEQITAVCTFVKGISRGLFVYVTDPESLAQADRSKARKIRRAMRRFNGAPFVYAISASPARLQEIDNAVRHFSGDRFMLHNR
jgi:uncharacterized integral membrane protein